MKIQSAELRLARDLRRLACQKDAEIRAKMFGTDFFAELRDEYRIMNGTASRGSRPQDINPIRRLSQLCRILDGADVRFIARNKPELSKGFLDNRRWLIGEYINELSYDLDVLWAAKRAQAEVKEAEFANLMRWRLETHLMLGELRMLCLLFGRADMTAAAAKIVDKIGTIIKTTTIEVGDLLPSPEFQQ